MKGLDYRKCFVAPITIGGNTLFCAAIQCRKKDYQKFLEPFDSVSKLHTNWKEFVVT